MREVPCLTRVVVGLTLRAKLLAYKREVKEEAFRVKIYCKKVVRWLREEL